MEEEKMLHRITSQRESIKITATTQEDVTFEEARNIALSDVFGKTADMAGYDPFIVSPITTKERYDRKTINFCPRCGANLHDCELEQSENFDCPECEVSMEVTIFSWED